MGQPLCYPPPHRYAGTVVEVSPGRLALDQGKRGTIYVGFVCEPSVCAQLGGVSKGDKLEVIFGATSITDSRPFTNKLLHVNKGPFENREMDFEPPPCMGVAEVAAAALKREKDTAPWPKTGVFVGYYRQTFEISDFRPAGTNERWWISGGIGRGCGMSAPCYVVVRGELSGLGGHGHMSAYNRKLRVTEVIEMRPLSPEEKAEVFKGL